MSVQTKDDTTRPSLGLFCGRKGSRSVAQGQGPSLRREPDDNPRPLRCFFQRRRI